MQRSLWKSKPRKHYQRRPFCQSYVQATKSWLPWTLRDVLVVLAITTALEAMCGTRDSMRVKLPETISCVMLSRDVTSLGLSFLFYRSAMTIANTAYTPHMRAAQPIPEADIRQCPHMLTVGLC